jgi:HEAT repeat protein
MVSFKLLFYPQDNLKLQEIATHLDKNELEIFSAKSLKKTNRNEWPTLDGAVVYADETLNSTLDFIKKKTKFRSFPLILIGKEKYFSSIPPGIDDYLNETADLKYIIFKIRAFFRRIDRERDSNPLTGLPGNASINRTIRNRLSADRDFDVIYIDINNFKAYNDVYGFSKGDDVLISMADILKRAVSEFKDIFVGHVGGDDFVVVYEEEAGADLFLKNLIEFFEEALNQFYNRTDLDRGFITAIDREGHMLHFPLMGMSMVVIHSEDIKEITSLEEIGARIARFKRMAKVKSSFRNRNICIDSHGAEDPVKVLEKIAVDYNQPQDKRREAIEALGQLGDKDSLSFLTKLLGKDTNYLIKKSTVYALGKLDPLSAKEVLIKTLKDQSAHVRMRAVGALGNIGGAEIYTYIMPLIKDKNKYVRREAISVLGRLGNEDAKTILVKLLGSKDINVKLNAVKALGDLSCEEAIPVFMRLSANAPINFLREIIFSLGRIRSAQAVEALGGFLDNDFYQAKLFALKALNYRLNKYGSQKIGEKILAKVRALSVDKNISLRREAIMVLGCLGEEKYRKPLIGLLSEKDSITRRNTAFVLGRLKIKQAQEKLALASQDRNEFVRAAAVWALGEIGTSLTSKSVSALRLRLKDYSERVRERAALAIAKVFK